MGGDIVIVDCSTCTVRGDACAGCVVTILFGGEPGSEVPWHRGARPDLLGPMEAGPGLSGPDLSGPDLSGPGRRAPDDIDRAIAVLTAAGMLAPLDAPIGVTLTGAVSWPQARLA